MRVQPREHKTGAALASALLILAVQLSARAELPRVRPESVLREDVSSAPVDPNSVAILTWLEGAGGFGLGRIQIDFSLEIVDADANAPILTFTPNDSHFSPDCDLDLVPVPPGGALEGQTGYECVTGGDCHLLVHDRVRGLLFEMFAANLTAQSFDGGCLAVWELGALYGPSGRGGNCVSADPAGLPLAPLLLDPDEVATGRIDHALRFLLPRDRIRAGAYVPPASATSGVGPAAAPPMGARLRLRPDFPLETLPNAAARKVARVLQRYGMILADAGSITLTARSDRFTATTWTGLLGPRDLQGIGVGDFEVLDSGAPVEFSFSCTREDPLPDVCGDLDETDRIEVSDVTRYRLSLADPLDSPLTARELSRCSVIGSESDCDIADVVVLRRLLKQHVPGIDPVCLANTPAICGNGMHEPLEACDDGNANDCGTCSSTCDVLRSLAVASGTITTGVADALADGETFTLNDGFNPATVFELDTAGDGVAGGRAPVFLAAAISANDVRDAILASVNSRPALNISASSGGSAVVELTNDLAGTHGNVPILKFVGDPEFTVSGMAGGAAGDCAPETGCVSASDCASGSCSFGLCD